MENIKILIESMYTFKYEEISKGTCCLLHKLKGLNINQQKKLIEGELSILNKYGSNYKAFLENSKNIKHLFSLEKYDSDIDEYECIIEDQPYISFLKNVEKILGTFEIEIPLYNIKVEKKYSSGSYYPVFEGDSLDNMKKVNNFMGNPFSLKEKTDIIK